MFDPKRLFGTAEWHWKPEMTSFLSALEINQNLHRIERQYLMFAMRLLSRCISLDDMKHHLRGKISADEIEILYANAVSTSRQTRMRSLIALFSLYGLSTNLIAEVLDLYPRTIDRHARKFAQYGMSRLYTLRRATRKYAVPAYKETLFAILHSPPKDYGFNRTAWRRKDLQIAMAQRGFLIGHNYIDRIIHDAGYRFRKARRVLTSDDPDYLEKVNRVKRILSRLTRTQRFFSVDEFGPFAVKQQGGRRWVAPGEHPTVPQIQKSKGCLIVTAALELSTNQITHFYSSKKNTEEMVKLVALLMKEYRDCSKLYISWDAAGWHASKRFVETIKRLNSRTFRKQFRTPRIELVPLPARAQFLNVIESVFSGLATSVIHNSDYASLDEAKAAIDRYFVERNAHFLANPKRAGGDIWKNERVPSTFREGQNCKNARFR